MPAPPNGKSQAKVTTQCIAIQYSRVHYATLQYDTIRYNNMERYNAAVPECAYSMTHCTWQSSSTHMIG